MRNVNTFHMSMYIITGEKKLNLRFDQSLRICCLSKSVLSTSELLPYFNLTLIFLFGVQYNLMVMADVVDQELLYARKYVKLGV